MIPALRGADPTTFETHSFHFGEHRLVYDVYGEGERVILYLHGILLDAELNRSLAAGLADQGFKVILLDLLGHGRSDKPPFASAHRMDAYALQVIALLDHLGLREVVLGGVSLGANVSLFVAAQYQERLRGLIVEMPVLEYAVPAAATFFVPLLLATHYGAPLLRLTSALLGRLPRSPVPPLNSFLNTASLPPENLAAVLHGILVGPITPTREAWASTMTPALVLGHHFDPLHPFHDAENLAALLPNAHLEHARSALEMRVFPGRLTRVLGEFAARCWDDEQPVTKSASSRAHE